MCTLIHRIASSIGLDDYSDCPDHEYYQSMVLYSAASVWARAAILDVNDSLLCQSKKHVTYVCNHFLDNVQKEMKFSDSLRKWFKPETESFGSVIVKNMIMSGLLVEIGFDPQNRKLSFPNFTGWHVSEKYAVDTKPLLESQDVLHMSGLSILDSNSENYDHPIMNDSNDIVKKWIGAVDSQGKEINLENSRFNVFDPRSIGADPYRLSNLNEHDEFNLIKRNINYKTQYIMKTRKGCCLIDDFLVDSKENHRLEFYLKSKHGNNSVKIQDYGDSLIKLDLYRALPSYESSLVRSVMWPFRNINDQTSFIGPEYLRGYLIKIICSLGLEVNV